ncbi:hypothetical protein CUMW_150850 [Citrus unshiu]|uniref:Uncharacterized protein n=1 Tax=Citrus unshiu TaxID=55188 RepID=A0A2H5PMU3_CITUN|nr:hypothetical protein CUMW_150850 [Citrus unshiu]
MGRKRKIPFDHVYLDSIEMTAKIIFCYCIHLTDQEIRMYRNSLLDGLLNIRHLQDCVKEVVLY